MKIRKAVITAAGRGQRRLPLQVFVDRDGEEKAALQIIIEEALSAGIEEIGVIVCPGDEPAYRAAAGDHAPKLTFMAQAEARGYGHALYQAKDFAAGQPFLHLVSDHLYLSLAEKTCARQLVEAAEAESCAVSAVQATRETMLAHYGVIGGRREKAGRPLYRVDRVLEKPTPTEAEQRLIVPGLRAGHYLCFFGMHVFTPALMDLLDKAVGASRENDAVQLSPCLNDLAARERYLALEVSGIRHNIGLKYGVLISQLALALNGKDREDVLAHLVELLATRRCGGGGK